VRRLKVHSACPDSATGAAAAVAAARGRIDSLDISWSLKIGDKVRKP
jgi:hypothetical protein